MNTSRKEMSVIECVLLAICPVFILWNGWSLLDRYWQKGFRWRFLSRFFSGGSYTIWYAAFAGAMLAFFLVWYWFGSTRRHERFGGFSVKELRPDILVLSAIMGLLLQRLTVAYILDSSRWNGAFFSAFYEKYQGVARGTFVGIGVLAVLLPLLEEIAFRGLTFGYLAKLLPFWAANLLQAAVFALYHQTPLQMAFSFVAGGFMGWLFYHTGRLRNCIAAHMVFNYLFIPMSAKLSTYSLTLENIFAVISLFLLAGVCMLIRRIGGKKS